MDNILGSIFGGQQEEQEFQDFSTRYEQGSPWDGISDDEAMTQYNRVSRRIPPDVYEESARESFGRLDPRQREELGQMLAQRAPQYGGQVSGSQLGDPNVLAQMTGQMHRQQPDLLGQILGGALGGGASGGGQSMAGGQGGGLLSSPIAKAALGGIAAMAVKRMTGGR